MVYGFDFPNLVAEDGPKRGDGNPYCITKIEGEEVVQTYVGKKNRSIITTLYPCSKFNSYGKMMEVIIVRPGDVYGPGFSPW